MYEVVSDHDWWLWLWGSGRGQGSEGEKQPSLPTFLIPCQEGANINKSLTTLGKVISALADLVRPGREEEGLWARGRRGWPTLTPFPLPSLSNQRSGSRILSLTGTLCSPGCSRRIWVRGSSSLCLSVSLPALPPALLTPSDTADQSCCHPWNLESSSCPLTLP